MSTYTDASLIVTPNAVKAGKLYALKGADLDVVRATTATYVGADGLIKTALANEVRFDYSNGSCPSILVEPQRTNLRTYSNDFSHISWNKAAITQTPNTIMSPDGGLNATTISIGIDASAARHRLSQLYVYTSGTTYTGTFFLKKANHIWIQICAVTGFPANVWANFDLENGVIGNTGGVGTTAKIENYGNGWYRCSITGVASSTGSFTGFEIITTNNTDSIRYPSYQSLVAEDVCYVWGAQLEVGSNATSYIPTTTASVTRNADVISKTGISSLIGQTQGTLYWEGRLQGQSFSDAAARMLLSISDGTSSNRIEIYRFNNIIYYDNVVGGSIQFSGTVFTITDFTGQPLKLAITYTLNNVKVFINGVLINTDTTALIPACSQIYIGSNRAGTSQWSGLIKGAVLLPLLTDTQAIQLTTL